MQALSEFFRQQSRVVIVIVGLLLIAITGLIDYAAGPELTFALFYVLIVAGVAWFTDPVTGLAASAIATIVWSFAEGPGLELSHWGAWLWNAGVRFGFFALVLYLLNALQTLVRRIETQALHDPLTGLENRRGFMQAAAHEVNRSKRYGHFFSIAYIDIDDFARVNDQHGYKGGDEVLRQVAESLRRNLRVTDMVARLDGDEFALLLPLTDTRQAPFVIDKVSAHLRSVQEVQGWPVSFSIGVVSFARAPLSVDEALTLADDAMYAAKKNGKGGVCYTRWE